MKKLTNFISWREITGQGGGILPDVEVDVLIYDGHIDDTFKGYLDVGPDGCTPVWISLATGDPLPDPQFWTYVPVPDEPEQVALPKPGQVVENIVLLSLLGSLGRHDIIAYLEKHGFPKTPFVSDGCSFWPDSWRGHDLYRACFGHDAWYWCGMPGDDVARLYADAELAKDVAAVAGADLARTMFAGVSFGGTEDFRTPFCWGYGREK